MKSKAEVLKMIERKRNAMIEKKKERGAWNENAYVAIWRGGECDCVFRHTNNGDFENWELLFDLTQMKGYYVDKITVKYANTTTFNIHLTRSEDKFTTNVDIEVLEKLKELATCSVGLFGTKDNEIALERHVLHRCRNIAKQMVKYGYGDGYKYGDNKIWYLRVKEGEHEDYVDLGYDDYCDHAGRWELLEKLTEYKDGYFVGGYSFQKQSVTITIKKIEHPEVNKSNITDEIIAKMEHYFD